MDFVIRRQSEKIDESSYGEPVDQSDKNYDYRNWEWLHLRVSDGVGYDKRWWIYQVSITQV